jgi:GntR family transcriptional repressor for pyruvate dehydrogenase complex
MEIVPIATKKIYQSIIEQFVNMLKDEKLKVGEKLPSERDLAEKFRVSRPSVREALRAMEMIGLIEIRPGDGVVVTDINIAPFMNAISPLLTKRKNFELELLELRRMFEVRAAELASESITKSKEKQLYVPLNKMKTALENGDKESGAEGDIEFHETIFLITDNYVLEKAAECVVTILEISVKFARSLMLENKQNAQMLLHQHERIFNAIVRGKPQIARKAMEEHLDFVVEFYSSRERS